MKQLGRFTKMAFRLTLNFEEDYRRIRLEKIEEAVFRNNLHELLCGHDGVIPLIVVLVEDGNKKNEVERRLKKRLELWTSQCIFYIPPVPKVITLDDNDFVYAEFVRDVKSVCDGKYKDLLANLDSLAQKRAPCVFVRFSSLLGLYPCVCDCSLEKATQLALELGTDLHFVLVIGDPGGLEEELCEQVFQVCRMAHLEDEEIKRIIDRMADERKTSYHHANLEKSRVVSLLLSPTVAELQEVLSNNVSLSLHIIYAGHAYDDGSWDISDGERFRESEIRKSLECIRFCNWIYLILDCCYAYKLFKDDVKKALETSYCVYLLEDPEPDAARKCIKKALNSDDQNCYSDSYDDQFFEEQRLFTKTVGKLYKLGFQRQSEKCRRLIPISESVKLKDLNGLPITLCVYPLSASHLDPQGAMSEFYGLKVNDDRISLSKRISGLLSRGKLERANVQVLRPTVNPQLVCFPAKNGDSTLFRWHGFNMLIDGGKSMKFPCFWPVVSRLPPTELLHEVIVTHFDADHICGILAMFQDHEFPITGRLHTTMPYKANPSGRSPKQGAKLVKMAEEKNVRCRNLKASPDPVIHVHFSQEGNIYITDHKKCTQNPHHLNGDCLKVYMLTPGPSVREYRRHVQKRVANPKIKRRMQGLLTDANVASASLLIHCRLKNGTSRFALLTGDAPCQPILEGLEKIIPCTNNKFQLHYADVPHHGSSKNDPSRFFSSIEASVVMISTNGSQHNHPDPETLLHLGKGLRDGRIKHACFTYNKEHEEKNVSTLVTEIPDNCKDKLLHFAPNKHDEEEPLNCTVIDLNGDALPNGFEPLGKVGYRVVNGKTDYF